MNFLERVDMLLNERGINKNQLSALTGIPVSTVYGWYKKGYGSITLPTLLKLSEFFNCSMEYLVNGNSAVSDQPSSAALDLARKFDRLDAHSQKVITTLVDLELKRPVSNIDAAREAMSDAIRRHEEAALLTNQAAAE